jgi:hypothetical protein
MHRVKRQPGKIIDNDRRRSDLEKGGNSSLAPELVDPYGLPKDAIFANGWE